MHMGGEEEQKAPAHDVLRVEQSMTMGVSGGRGLPEIGYCTDPKVADKKKA